VLFRQERLGIHGVKCQMYKFRTMRIDTPQLPSHMIDATAWLTPVGGFLRATSLDELPQLLHVLSGKMALVGPRPLPTAYLPRYSPEQARRHEVRPGITGWAQVNGRNAISWDEKFRLDVWYVDNRSLLLDAKILFLTVWRTLRRDGINHPGADTMEEFRGRG
jgi:sugar transferase EpsL